MYTNWTEFKLNGLNLNCIGYNLHQTVKKHMLFYSNHFICIPTLNNII